MSKQPEPLTDQDELWLVVTARQLTGGQESVPAALVLKAMRHVMEMERTRAVVRKLGMLQPVSFERPSTTPPDLPPSTPEREEHDLDDHDQE